MHVYFSGIGGAAIGPLALICRDAGYEVSGSDITESLFTHRLDEAGVTVFIGQDGSQIAEVHEAKPIDWLVISSSLPPEHPEIAFAKEHGIKVTKRADMINQVLKDTGLKLVAIAGTHGKTTTTAMLVWLFRQFDQPVSYSIGSNIGFGESGRYEPGSTYFVYECDEYDRNMLSFRPYMSLVTNVDYDHPDIYPTKIAYNEAFEQFVGQSERVVMWQRDAEALGVEHAVQVCLEPDDSEIATIALAGQHNRENGWAAATVFDELFPKFGMQKILEKLATFPGTERRFERLAERVYTDYAHHPAEIKATIQMARELSDDVVVIYQPHQNIRQHKIVKKYGASFAEATRVYWLPTYLTREDPNLKTLTPQDLISHLEKPEIAEPADMNEALLKKLEAAHKAGALLVFMGAGTIDSWARDHVADLV